MLELHLARFARERVVHVAGEIPGDEPVWEESGLDLAGPLTVRLRAQEAGSREIVVRGRAQGVLRYECRRCLTPVRRDLNTQLTLVYVSSALLNDFDDGDVRPMPERAAVLDLAVAVREEVILSVDRYAVCDPDCRGLCPACGANLNDETCACAPGEPDPRWEVLRQLPKE